MYSATLANPFTSLSLHWLFHSTGIMVPVPWDCGGLGVRDRGGNTPSTEPAQGWCLLRKHSSSLLVSFYWMLIDHHVATSFSIPTPLCPLVHVSGTALSWLGRELDLPGGLQAPPGQISFPHQTEFFQVWDCAIPIRLGTHQGRDKFFLSLPGPPPLSTSAPPVLSG